MLLPNVACFTLELVNMIVEIRNDPKVFVNVTIWCYNNF